MIKILFICRSPMAEFIMKKIAAEKGLASCLEIASAATSREEIYLGVGNPVYPPARKELESHGISCEGKRARQIRPEDADYYDLLIAMEPVNLRNMDSILQGRGWDKSHLLLDFAGESRGISDPWYSGDFQTAYRDIERGCSCLLEYLRKEGHI